MNGKTEWFVSHQSPDDCLALIVQEGPGKTKLVATVILNSLAALIAAYDHLDYSGFGDRWERECAKADGLEETIRTAIHEAQGDCPPKEIA